MSLETKKHPALEANRYRAFSPRDGPNIILRSDAPRVLKPIDNEDHQEHT
jgi:hypothetical protein